MSVQLGGGSVVVVVRRMRQEGMESRSQASVSSSPKHEDTLASAPTVGAGVVGAGAATQTRLPSPAESTQLKPAQQPASAVHVWPSAVQEEAATQTKLPPLSSQLKPAQQPASAV